MFAVYWRTWHKHCKSGLSVTIQNLTRKVCRNQDHLFCHFPLKKIIKMLIYDITKAFFHPITNKEKKRILWLMTFPSECSTHYVKWRRRIVGAYFRLHTLDARVTIRITSKCRRPFYHCAFIEYSRVLYTYNMKVSLIWKH